MKTIVTTLVFIGALGTLGAYRSAPQGSSLESRAANLFSRKYREGQKLSYHMRATNKNRLRTMSYEAQADGVVKKDAAGHFYEEYEWSHVIWDGQAAPVPPDFRQILSLDLGSRPQVPDSQHAGPALVGPTLDLFTFYTDLMMALHQPSLNAAGDHAYVKLGGPNSWASGEGLILGEDSIDFDLTVESVGRNANVATLLVRHVPPQQPSIHLPAVWMHAPIANAANNWVEVGKTQAGKYVARIGMETFDDVIRISLSDGSVLSATMDNPVEVSERECNDAALAVCGAPTRYQIRRQISIE